MVVKRHYGKIYLTDRGAFTVNYYRRLLDATLAAMPEYPFPVSADERAQCGPGIDCSAS